MPRKPAKLKTVPDAPNFAALVEVVRQVHEQSAAAAGRAVNVSLTLRNWLIGWHIREYEQSGADRAEYGDRLLDRLAQALRQKGVTPCGCSRVAALPALLASIWSIRTFGSR